MTQPILIYQRGGSGGGMAQAALNFDYDALRHAVREWKGTRTFRATAEIADIHYTNLYEFLRGKLVTWDTVQKLCTAMHRDTGEFLR